MKNINKNTEKTRTLYIIIILIIVAFAGAGVYGYKMLNDSKKETARLKQENTKLANPQESAKLQIERIKNDVAKLIDVPQDENPEISNVDDISKLPKVAFYTKAQNGDKVLFYAKAKKAILYRPSSNKIIEATIIGGANKSETPKPDAATDTTGQ